MNTTEAARRMLDGAVGLLDGDEYAWELRRFRGRKLGTNKWITQESLPRSDNWQILCEPKPQETERWVRVESGDRLVFGNPTGPWRDLSFVLSQHGKRLVGYEFEGYKGVYPSPIMWEHPIDCALQPSARYPCSLGERRVASAVILLQKEA